MHESNFLKNQLTLALKNTNSRRYKNKKNIFDKNMFRTVMQAAQFRELILVNRVKKNRFLLANLVWASLAFSFVSSSMAQEATNPNAVQESSEVGDLPTVEAVRVSSTPQRARLVIDLTGVSSFAFVSLDEPKRIAIDVRASGSQSQTEGEAAGQGLIGSYSITMIGQDRLRTILMLSASAQVQQAYVLEPFADQPARLVVDIIGASDEEFLARVAADEAASANLGANGEQGEGVSGEVNLDQVSDLPGASQIQTNSRPLILIDPGHGGSDGGARASNGVREKAITLMFAEQLREVLISSGRFDVALTREGDEAVMLEERVQLARDNRADLLVSLHADSFEDNQIRGASVYIRDEQATDVLDKVLAENENKSDLLAGFGIEQLEQTEGAVVNLLVDLMRREMRRQSFSAALAIVEQLRQSVRIRRFPMRRADFFVLQSPDVPAVLVELGFLSNDLDVRNLTSEQWRKRVADAVARGIGSYFDGIKQ